VLYRSSARFRRLVPVEKSRRHHRLRDSTAHFDRAIAGVPSTSIREPVPGVGVRDYETRFSGRLPLEFSAWRNFQRELRGVLCCRSAVVNSQLNPSRATPQPPHVTRSACGSLYRTEYAGARHQRHTPGGSPAVQERDGLYGEESREARVL
jgi:hypothetical protein